VGKKVGSCNGAVIYRMSSCALKGGQFLDHLYNQFLEKYSFYHGVK
jgi:hypothetical protein